MVKSNTTQILSRTTIFLFLLLLSVITILPFIFLLLASFKPAIELFRFGLSLNIDFQN